METMTREQNEEWQAAIPPLDYLDFHALSAEGLQKSAERLSGRGVPGWAWKLRFSLMDWGSDSMEAWCPGFAIRSETALVGIQILNRGHDLTPIYQRVFVRFFQEGLHPVVEHIRQSDALIARFQPLLTLYGLCQAFVLPANLDNWPDAYTLFPDPRFPMLGSSPEKPNYEEPIEVVEEPLEIRYAFHLGRTMLLQIHSHLHPEHPIRWNDSYSGLLVATLRSLNGLHQWRLEGRFAMGKLSPRVAPGKCDASYKYLIAAAYLIALEAECPAPGWLSNV